MGRVFLFEKKEVTLGLWGRENLNYTYIFFIHSKGGYDAMYVQCTVHSQGSHLPFWSRQAPQTLLTSGSYCIQATANAGNEDLCVPIFPKSIQEAGGLLIKSDTDQTKCRRVFSL